VRRHGTSVSDTDKSVVIRPNGDFFVIQDGGRRHLGFSKFQILTVGTVKRIELRHHTNFR